MRVLVTGGAGFIGSHVVDALRSGGHEVVVLDNLSHGSREVLPPSVPFIEGDILEPDQWVAAVGSVDVVIHLAAQIRVEYAESHPEVDVRTNVEGTVRILQAARALGAREIRFASSAAVYGDNPHVPLAEDATCAPISYYGLDKWTGEHYVRFEESRGGLAAVILRLANVYGPRQRTAGEGGVVAVFAEALARGDRPWIHGDGQQTRDFISVWDVARAFTHRLGSPEASGTYNIGTETATTVNTLWQHLAQIAGVDVKAVRYGPARPGDIRHSRLRTARARQWGFEPRVPLVEGLRLTYEDFVARAHAAP
ncbi:MAG: NAD-dependent epimerase/dehydratase family protein [Firmicutes bacterium]|nr:NAD-dependent epimerase/dehydratase family protein [Bacillota bacterium]